MKKYIAACAMALLLACTASGPKKALDDIAKSMEDNNSQAFLAQIDMPAYAANFVKSMTANNEALNSLNVFGQMLGLGNIDQLIDSVVDVRARLADEFNRGVASGELMAQCRDATTPDCPWVPQSLRQAEVKELGQDAAIAKVTTPARLTCWLALRKNNGKWQIVGRAVLEDEAAAMARAGASAVQKGAQQGGAAPQKPVNI